MKRVVEYWHPDRSSLSIQRKRDVRLTMAALHSVAVQGDETAAMLLRNTKGDGKEAAETLAAADCTFSRSYTPTVINALANYARTQENHPLQIHRAQGLIGQLMIAGGSAMEVIRQ